LRISLHATRDPPTASAITMSLLFSNNTDQPISELTFMAAVTKASRSQIILGIANQVVRGIRSSFNHRAEDDSNRMSMVVLSN
jgi:hypothetical protein